MGGAGGGGGATSTWEEASPETSRVQSGGNGGRGAYTVGLRLLSHPCDLRGLVFMWCAVAFFCGLDEHSITNPPLPPPNEPIFAPPRLNDVKPEEMGNTKTLDPNAAEIDMVVFLLRFRLWNSLSERARGPIKMGLCGPLDCGWEIEITLLSTQKCQCASHRRNSIPLWASLFLIFDFGPIWMYLSIAEHFTVYRNGSWVQ